MGQGVVTPLGTQPIERAGKLGVPFYDSRQLALASAGLRQIFRHLVKRQNPGDGTGKLRSQVARFHFAMKGPHRFTAQPAEFGREAIRRVVQICVPGEKFEDQD